MPPDRAGRFAPAPPGSTGVRATKQAADVSNGRVSWEVDLSDLDTGTFTVTLDGTDDLDFGTASRSTTIAVTGRDDVRLVFDRRTVTRGQDATFRIRESSAGEYHVVTVDDDEFRGGIASGDRERLFRRVGDTELTGYSASARFAYAVVEIDDGTASASAS